MPEAARGFRSRPQDGGVRPPAATANIATPILSGNSRKRHKLVNNL